MVCAVRSLIVLLLCAICVRAAPLVIKNAKVYTVTGKVIGRGTVVVIDGKIRAVGPTAEIRIPAGATVVDGTGLVLIPGLVDSHSHLGVYSRPLWVAANADGNETTGPVQGIVRAMDSLFPSDPGFRQGVAGGVTTANVMPGSGNVMGGQTAYIKLRGRTVEEMLIDLKGGPSGMKMANGENPKRSYGRRGKAPATRMKIAALQREVFLKAQRYRKERDKDKDVPRDLALDPVVDILKGRRTVHFHTHRADDVMSALRLKDEFGFELVLHHGTEAYMVGEEVAKRGVAVSFTLVDSPGGKPEALNLQFENVAKMAAAGIKVALNTDDPITESRLLLRTAALAVRGGLAPDLGLKAITINPAAMMHLETRVGSIEVGKDGDLVLLSGEPFSVYTHVLITWIEGELVYERARLADRRHATGGYHVRERMPRKARSILAPPFLPVKIPIGEKVADAKTFVVRARYLHTAAGRTLNDHAVFVEQGRIRAIMPAAEARFPGGVKTFSFMHVTPGLIDAHASAGLSGALNVPADQDLSEPTGPNQAALRALDGFNPRERLLGYLLRHGVTVLQCVPGPRNPISGQAGIFTTTGKTVRFPSAMVFNLGEGPKRNDGQAPGTRMGTAAIIRQALAEAKWPGKKDADNAIDLNRAALQPVLRGELPAVFVAHREDDIVTALRIAREFGLKLVLSQATEGFLLPDRLKGVMVLAAPTMQRAGGLERYNSCFENAAIMADAGVRLAITSGYESYVPKTRVILFEAGVAAANGLGFDRALRAVTIDAARALGIDREFGSIERGKRADLACFDGDPFEYTSHCQAVFVEGRLVYAR